MPTFTKPLNAFYQNRNLIDDLIITSSKNVRLIEIEHQQRADGACQRFCEKAYYPTPFRDVIAERQS